MTIQFSPGRERKKLAAAVAVHLGTKSTYAGMPSAAYIVGSYTLTRESALIGPDDRDLVAALTRQGFEPVEEAYDAEPAGPEGEAARPQPDRLAIEVAIDVSFTPAKMDNLKKLIASRETLLKKVLGADILPIEQTPTALKFEWFPLDDNAQVYGQLACALVRVATEATRITVKEQQECASEKFRMRTYLLKLGFIGDTYRQARKVLTRGLSGNGSYAKAKEPLPPQESSGATTDGRVKVARPPEGISLNGATEFLLDDDNEPLVFNSQEAAEAFLLEHGYPQEALEDLRFFPPTP